MKLQLALDRLTVPEAIAVARRAEAHVDWIEIGTSLVKEFGMESVRAFRAAFPGKTLLADMKINDNARYECKIAFDAGADVVTVMGTAPTATLRSVMEEVRRAGKTVVIDLLNADERTRRALRDAFTDAVFCLHTGKDEQEEAGAVFGAAELDWSGRRTAAAGGLTLDRLPDIRAAYGTEIFVVGGAIAKARDPGAAARAFQEKIRGV